MLLDRLPPGWTLKESRRKTGRKDYVLTSPTGIRFVSIKSAVRHLRKQGVGVDFTKLKRTITTPKSSGGSFAQDVEFGGRDQCAQTPDDVLDHVHQTYGEFYDPCPPNPTRDGLITDWKQMNYVNPPFAEVEDWLAKTLEQHAKGRSTVLLLHARTCAGWFHHYVLKAHSIAFIEGGIRFKNYTRVSPFPLLFVYFDGSRPLGDSPPVLKSLTRYSFAKKWR